MKRTGKRLLSLLLTAVMLLSLLPTTALAADYNWTNASNASFAEGDTYTGDTAPEAPTGMEWVDTGNTGVGCLLVNADTSHTAHTADCYTDTVICTKSIAFLNHSASCIPNAEKCDSYGIGCSHSDHYYSGSGFFKSCYGGTCNGSCTHTHSWEEGCYALNVNSCPNATLHQHNDDCQKTIWKLQWVPYTVTWVNWDGTPLETDENVTYNVGATYDGETPARVGDSDYSVYAFTGWDKSAGPNTILENTTITAQFTGKHTIIWKDEDGKTLETDYLEDGVTPTYDGETPTKADEGATTYTFVG